MHRRTRSRVLLAVCLTAFVPGCYQRTERLPEIDAEARRSDDGRPELSVCVVPTGPPREAILRYGPVASRISATTSRRAVLRPAATWDLAIDRLRTGETDLALLGAVAAVRAARRYGVVPLARIVENGDSGWRAAILVRSDDPARELADLRGRRLGLVGPESAAGQLLPISALPGAGLEIRDLGGVRYLDRHELVARAVQLEEVDAGAVRESVAERFARRGLRILWRSGTFPGPVLASRPGVPVAVREEVRRALIGAKDGIAPGGVPVDSSVRLRFTAVSEGDNAAVRNLLIRVHGEEALEAELAIEGTRR